MLEVIETVLECSVFVLCSFTVDRISLCLDVLSRLLLATLPGTLFVIFITVARSELNVIEGGLIVAVGLST
jgi:hypothetical protein